MNFREIQWEDIEWMEPLLRASPYKSSEYCFSNLYNWRKIYKTEAAQRGNLGIVRSSAAGGSYLYPFGAGEAAEVAQAIEQMVEYSAQRGEPFCIFGTPREGVEELERLFPGRFLFQYDRDHCDYLYAAEKLGQLQGKKLHAKRSHIRKFQETCPDWEYRPITPQTIDLCRSLNQVWYREKAQAGFRGLGPERLAVETALDHFEGEGLAGGILLAGGKAVGYSFGRPLDQQVFVVHAEKAFAQVPGAYPMLNQQFVLHHCGGCQYVNREDDAGAEGLRKAKLSYYPDILLEKYIVRLKEE